MSSFLKSLVLFFAFLSLSFVFSSTASAATQPKKVAVSFSHINPPMPAAQAKMLLRSMPEKWRGVRYRFGGTSRRSGIDCSAFVQAVYKDVFNVDIPRNTMGQRTVGESVSKYDMKMGDIIIFQSRASGSGRHVGIYVGDMQFLHISSGRNAVVVANLTSYDGAPGLRISTVRRIPNLVNDAPFNYDENFKPIIADDTMKQIIANGQFVY